MKILAYLWRKLIMHLRLMNMFIKAYREKGADMLTIMLKVAAGVNTGTSSRYELSRVAKYIGIPESELLKKTRKREIVEARQVAMYLAKKNTKESLAEIGWNLGRKDHATVIHACRTVENLLETNHSFRIKWMPLIIAQ